MSQHTDPQDHPAPETEGLERMDVETAASAARHRHKPVVRVLGTASEVADQIPLGVVCGAVIVGGLIADRPDAVRTGVRMLAAHVVANVVKRRIKNRLRRTRPGEVVKKRSYTFEPGESQGGHETSFPSGHTAGAVAVAAIVARDAPALAIPAWGTAALIAGVQVPRGKHYPGDIAAGAILGLAAAWLVDRCLDHSRLSRVSQPILHPDGDRPTKTPSSGTS